MRNFIKLIGVRTDAYRINDEVYESSRIARAGQRAIHLAVIIRAVEPLLVISAMAILMIVVAAHPALAQTPGGNIFGGNDQSLGNGVREAGEYVSPLRWLGGLPRAVLLPLGDEA